MTERSQAEQLIDFYTLPEPRMQNRWVLVDKTTRAKLGTCGYHCWDPDKQEVEIGFELMEPYNGKGYMLEAVNAILDFARQVMKVDRIVAIVSIENESCIKLVQRLGFIRVGEQETTFRGQIHLHHRFALTL